MSLVNAKCPNCGASIQIDNKLEEGFCSYCGTKIQVKEAITNINVTFDRSKDLSNYIDLSIEALKGGNPTEALIHANNALAIDSKSSLAWYTKYTALTRLGENYDDLAIGQIINCGNNAIKYGIEDDTKIKIYKHNLSWACEIIKFSAQQISNPEIRFTTNEPILPLIAQLRLSVPIEEITSLNLTNDAIVFFKNYSICGKSIVKNHIASPDFDKKRDEYNQLVNKLAEGLPIKNIQSFLFSIEDIKSAGACYIATAVYGSYDAPQVLVLRAYRDNILSRTIFGRLFIKTYYKLSPPIANKLKHKSKMNNLVRIILDKFVYHLRNNNI